LGTSPPPRSRALKLYLALWAVIFPIQTFVVIHESGGDDFEPLYFIFNACILALGVSLNTYGSRLGERRTVAAALK
jgi:hypothetical protein